MNIEQLDAAADFVYLRQSLPKARQEHKCDVCEGKIESGNRYVLTVFVEESTFGVHKECIPCPYRSNG